MNKGSRKEMNVIGIDVSKAKLDCAWLDENNKLKAKVFPNALTGWSSLVEWSLKHTGLSISGLHFVMEATGVCHGQLAVYLYDKGANVSVVNPAQVKFYAQSLGVRSKNDKKDSVVLARYGLHEKPKRWQPEALEIGTLKALVARLDSLEKDLQRERNRREKAEISQAPPAILASLAQIIGTLDAERQQLEKLIEEHLNNHELLKQNKALLESIPGVGKVIATRMLMVIGSRPFDSASQCAAYLGLVPVQHESGSSVRGRAKLSKAGKPGHPHPRQTVHGGGGGDHLQSRHQAQYLRLTGNGKSKMSALGAAMRKLVQICFGVLKHQQPYQPQVAN
ncbi:IS110 family transposase [Methyloglobulus sp.]|uniref:IS110 family transposase n=1 Tax=Methyloglobulus sp. TaxID=2518622 RepID=UPI0032B87CBD